MATRFRLRSLVLCRGLGDPHARVAEIMRVGAERAEVTAEEVIRELKKLGVRKHDAGFNRM